MHGDNIHMLLNSYTIIITFHTFYLSPFLPIPYFSSITLSLLPTTFMSLNPMAQHHPQAWYWQPSVAPFHQSHHQHPCYLQVEHAAEDQVIEREHMFEKPLTPSDVGKLNRLVIPKQHAERYFPLDGDSCDKGLQLCFEDESGKSWRFRYSYWTSSQSYVLTKGWSRFVKEKSLDAGDIVLFGRLRAGGDRLYIGCRRRGADESAATPARRAAAPWVSACYGAAGHSYPSNPDCPPYVPPSSVQQQYGHHAGEQREEVADSAAATPTNSKRLIRLFGVNLDCGPVPETQNSLSSSSWLSEQL